MFISEWNGGKGGREWEWNGGENDKKTFFLAISLLPLPGAECVIHDPGKCSEF